MPIKDFTGQKFSRLLVIEFVKTLNYKSFWRCVCDCGNEKIVKGNSLQNGSTKSCGCLRKERTSALGKANDKTTHGYSNTKEYRSWHEAKGRCTNPKNKAFPWYGGKGITMSEEFINDPKAWCEYLGPPPDNKIKWSVDRIDPSGNYERGNIKWAKPAEQVRNRKANKNNTSGITGVTFHTSNNNVEYWMARWFKLDGKVGSKSFSIKKYGEELAKFLAEETRDLEIKKLNILGANYSEFHGK